MGLRGKIFLRLKKRILKGICKAYGCKKPSLVKLGGFCYRCYARNVKHRNPLKYAFDFHRRNALRRGHEWLLTYDQFKYFWEVLFPEFWELKKANILKPPTIAKVKQRTCLYELDRIDESLPYQWGNLQCVTKLINVDKSWHYRKRVMEWEVTCTKNAGLPVTVFSSITEEDSPEFLDFDYYTN